MVFTVYGLPSGTRPARDILSFASSISWRTVMSVNSPCFFKDVAILTLSEKSQFGLAVPGVSGKKKYARIAIGREMTPLMTGYHTVSVSIESKK